MREAEAIEQFRAAMQAKGLEPDEIIADGAIHRFATNADREDDAGWYVLHADGIPAGAFGDWREGISETWRYDPGRELTAEEQAQCQRKTDEAKRLSDAER